MRRVFILILVVCFILCSCNFNVSYGEPSPITVPNGSFENPSDASKTGVMVNMDDWIEGGSWYGRFRWPEGVYDGEYAAWASFTDNNSQNNPDNSFSQELSDVFTPGMYTLSVKTMGDNTQGLTSRLTLGYNSGNNTYVELKSSDMQISYTAGDDLKNKWITQTVEVEIKKSSKAIGKPIWIKVSSVTNASGQGGNSCLWDDVKLSTAYPL